MGRRRKGARLGPTSGFPARRSSWPAALLAASILSSCFPLTQAQNIPVTVEPSQPFEGQDVTLTPGGSLPFFVCTWYRDLPTNWILTYVTSPQTVQVNGPASTGRETGGPDCSMHIRSLILNDSGIYTVSKTLKNFSVPTGRVHIEVLEKLSQPVLWPAASIVKEHDNVTLNCSTSESSSVTVSWLKDGKTIPVKSILSARNRTLTVPDVGKDDEGVYTCEARNLANSATSNPSKIALEKDHSSLGAGAIAGIVLGSLVIAALAGTLLYCFFRARRQKDKNSKQMNQTSPIYENTRPSAQVKPENSSGVDQTYEELQYKNQPEYDQLRW